VTRDVESHSGARGDIFAGPLWEFFFAFFFLKWRILVYFIYMSDDGGPQRRGAWGDGPKSDSDVL